MANAKQLFENTDPDSPENFGVAKHLDSPVARIAATSGFKLSRVSNEERWVKELSNGKEVWLRTISSREYELPMDFQNGRGGREWELVEYTKVNGRYTNPKLLIRTNEVAMSYVLGAHLQRLATWPADMPKPTLESVPVPDPDDPTTAVSSFIKSKTPYYPDYAKLARYIADNRENVYISGKITRHGRYVHENSTTFELNIESNDLPDEIAVLANVVEKQIGEELVRINKKIYRSLEREWDSRNSDEYIDEWLREQDDIYNELGNHWDGDDDIDEPQLTYAELSDRAKSQARDNYRQGSYNQGWEEHILEEWKTEIEDMGFADPDISYSGFSSQGDGASFTSNSFDFMKWVEWHMSNKPLERGHPYTDDLFLKESTDPDDPGMVFQQFLKTYVQDSAILKVYDYLNEHQFAGSTCQHCEGTGDAVEWMQNMDLPYQECPHCDQGEVEDGSYRQVVHLWNAAGPELEQLFARLADVEQRATGKVNPRKDKQITKLFDYMQSPDGDYDEVAHLSHKAGSEIEYMVKRIKALESNLSRRKPRRESLDEPSKEHMIHMGRAGECDQPCQHCGAFCTLRHYNLDGQQMPKYHICLQCDAASADTEDDDARIAAAGLRRMAHQQVQEDGPDDPAVFMKSLEQMPDHELVNTSSPAPETSRSVACTCGTWGFSGIARNAAEQAEFDEAVKIEYAKHIQYPHIDTGTNAPADKLHVRNLITARRLKEGVDDPAPRYLDQIVSKIKAHTAVQSKKLNARYAGSQPMQGVVLYSTRRIGGDAYSVVYMVQFPHNRSFSGFYDHDDLIPIAYDNSDLNEANYNFPDQGEQDKPEHWADDPEPDVDDPTAVLKQEVAKRSEPIKKLHIYGRRWYRRGAGGVYCKAYIYINDKLVHVTPEQYGYNDHYLTLATDWLRQEGYLEGLLAPNEPIWYLWDKKLVPDLMYYVTDVKRERDL